MRPRVRVMCCIAGGDLDLAEISRILGVTTMSTRLKEDFPEVSQRMGFAHDEWVYALPRVECASISERLEALEGVFGDRAGQIFAIRESYAARVSVGLFVHAVIGDEPALPLARGNLAFF